MTAETANLETLLGRIRNGSQEAAWELIEQYGRHVYRLVRRQMSAEMRSICDSEDFVQAVWGSFFTDSQKLHDIDDSAQMLAVLAAMARNKVIDEVRRRRAVKRLDLTRGKSIDAADPEQTPAIRSREPTPSQVAMARERWDDLLTGATERERDILRMRFEGLSYAEIAGRLDVSERTVLRAMGLLRQRVP